jgi:hypothetical protein
MSHHFYIYYRIRPETAADAHASVSRLTREIEQRTGILGRVVRRMEDPTLWMETYLNVPDAQAFETVLHEAASNAGVDSYLTANSARKVERFRDFGDDPCA